MPRAPPLSILPLSSILRSLAITSLSSSRLLLPPSLAIMSKLAHTTSPILSPDTNPLLRFFLKKTFYTQFCAGENAQEVNRTVDRLRNLGFNGVILAYAKEVVMDEKEAGSLSSCGKSEAAELCIRNEIRPWANGTLDTIRMTCPGDYVALKFTGAGSQALHDLSKHFDPSPALKESIDEICDLAAERGVRLLFDAEQQALQAGIDAWTLSYMRKYNGREPGRAIIFGTYQAYLKATPRILASHLAAAAKDKFTLGVKLVRGAYLGSDPRHLIHDTKADTDAAYNGIAESLAKRSYNNILKPEQDSLTEFPSVNVVLAGHNITSVREIKALRDSQAKNVQTGKIAEAEAHKGVDIPKTYKYLVWGTTGECMKYLLRRAQENRDAFERTREGRNAMARELWRRVKKAVGAA